MLIEENISLKNYYLRKNLEHIRQKITSVIKYTQNLNSIVSQKIIQEYLRNIFYHLKDITSKF